MAGNEKVRVYDLARELGLSNKELLALLEKEGVEVKSHASSLDAETANLVRDMVIAEREKKKKALDAKIATPATAPAATPKTDKPAAQPQKPAEAVQPKIAAPVMQPPKPAGGKELHLKSPITVRDLADGLGVKPNELITRLMMMNIFAAINQVLDEDLVGKVCDQYGVKFIKVRRDKQQAQTQQKAGDAAPTERPAHLVSRPPVVVFMGHVDHGKTSIQDYIRKTHVAAGEAGGITQAIGASVANVGNQTITFLDTPGHEAFTAMRARGANATDIAVLVVAADDGIMPQTVEAIHHAQAAKVPIIVAMNKMDLPGANPDKVYRGLQQNGILPEDYGGEYAVVPVSAKTGMGINDLLDRILLEAEMLELKADPGAPFKGLVIEAQMETGMGPTASIIVQDGTLRVGDYLLCGKCYGKVKALIDSQGRRVAKALPSTPVKIMGLNGVPEAGEKIVICENEREAREKAQEIIDLERSEVPTERTVSLDNLFAQLDAQEKPTLKLILKTDVRGSLEAIVDSINKIKSDRVSVSVIHSGVGEITENDVILAAASKAVIMGFHVRAMPGVNKVAKQKGIEIRLHSIIYDLLAEVENAMRGQLAPEIQEKFLGRAEIIQVIEVSKVGKICGCKVIDGLIRVNAKAKVYRNKELIYNGQIQSLKHFKEDVREMKAGLECGIRLDNFEDFEEHDVIEVFEAIQVAAQL
ncbi:MAG: translation initiation factor IF-2 [Victivallales bacterium]|nr:translation initiation factor IF-2 [Victivallales bacterium]